MTFLNLNAVWDLAAQFSKDGPWMMLTLVLAVVLGMVFFSHSKVKQNRGHASLAELMKRYNVLPEPKLREKLDISLPALMLDEPLQNACDVLAKGHAALQQPEENSRSAALVTILACSGKGKSRFVYELAKRLNVQDDSVCIPITFNGDQHMSTGIHDIEELTQNKHGRAKLHIGMRLLHSTFEVDQLPEFVALFCKAVKQQYSGRPGYTFLLDVLRLYRNHQQKKIKSLTILTDESGRLQNYLKMPQGDADEFSVLRELMQKHVATELGFSIMVVQAGLGDFAVTHTVSGRNLWVISLLDLDEDGVINKLIMPEFQQVLDGGLAANMATQCDQKCAEYVKDPDLWKKLVIAPLVSECRMLPRAVENLKKAIKELNNPMVVTQIVPASKQLTNRKEVGCAMRSIGVHIRSKLDHFLNLTYSSVAKHLTPAVLAPAILPSKKLKINLRSKIGHFQASELVSEASYVNSLASVGQLDEFLPAILPAFLRQAANELKDLDRLKEWWEIMGEQLENQAQGIESTGKFLETGVRVWTYTILKALSKWHNQLKCDLTLQDIFKSSSVQEGKKDWEYVMGAPRDVYAEKLEIPLPDSQLLLERAIDRAKTHQVATVLELPVGQEGVDLIAILPLLGNALLLGIEPHGGAAKGRKSVARHSGHPQDKRARFWCQLPKQIKDANIDRALLYITHDAFQDTGEISFVLSEKWPCTQRMGVPTLQEMNVLLMDKTGLQAFLGVLWDQYRQVRFMPES